MKEYRIVHDLGPSFVAPLRVLDLELAKIEVDRMRELSKKIHVDEADIANGWRIESRIVTEWEKEDYEQ